MPQKRCPRSKSTALWARSFASAGVCCAKVLMCWKRMIYASRQSHCPHGCATYTFVWSLVSSCASAQAWGDVILMVSNTKELFGENQLAAPSSALFRLKGGKADQTARQPSSSNTMRTSPETSGTLCAGRAARTTKSLPIPLAFVAFASMRLRLCHQ
jgi:hypothetical protein